VAAIKGFFDASSSTPIAGFLRSGSKHATQIECRTVSLLMIGGSPLAVVHPQTGAIVTRASSWSPDDKSLRGKENSG